jgi:hypothetical protein
LKVERKDEEFYTEVTESTEGTEKKKRWQGCWRYKEEPYD